MSALLARALRLLLLVGAAADPSGPYVLPLHREIYSTVRNGQTVSLRSVYYGKVSLGAPKPQEFSVVFDTGSGHVVVPSTGCEDQTCREHRRYSLTSSESAVAVHSDGEPVPDDELPDEVTIGFGTGTLTGQFAREQVCLGSAAEGNLSGTVVAGKTAAGRAPCSTVNIVMAMKMSDQPFRSFRFDGIFGLGLGGLALGPEFSFFHQLANSSSFRPLAPRFAIFLASAEGGEGSEIAIGGHNAARLAAPFKWEPVALSELGYWQVQIGAFHIGSEALPLCQSGDCRAVLDTGTSHIGVPRHHLKQLMELFTTPMPPGAGDCRNVSSPTLSFQLRNVTLTIHPEDYMQPEPYKRRGSLTGTQRLVCRPALMPVNFKAPLGPDLFILGEPLLRRYYTVYDWGTRSVGFGLAQTGSAATGAKATTPPEEEEAVLLLQVFMVLGPQQRHEAPSAEDARGGRLLSP